MTGPVLDLNNPDTRQAVMLERLQVGDTLVAREIVKEFNVSIDTIRRDLIALEGLGLLKRVKGGAIPIKPLQQIPAAPMAQRLQTQTNWMEKVAIDNPNKTSEAFSDLMVGSPTLFLDGGTSVLFLARQLPHDFSGVVITPSPLIAGVMLEKEIETVMIGGKIKPLGGISTGLEAVRSLSDCTADYAVLGTCGLDPRFGLSADDLDEAAVKQTMARNAQKTVVLASADKVNTQSRHRVIPCMDIDVLITNAPKSETMVYKLSEIEVRHV
ncbi:MAG: DeoR/GlpR family DNA-binding transcription regulator [Halopseudomonas aestusnigri]